METLTGTGSTTAEVDEVYTTDLMGRKVIADPLAQAVNCASCKDQLVDGDGNRLAARFSVPTYDRVFLNENETGENAPKAIRATGQVLTMCFRCQSDYRSAVSVFRLELGEGKAQP